MTYYVDQNAPGASNTACDGLAPTNEGNGHCPFLDLSHPAPRTGTTYARPPCA
ncbi:MAG: hypothetical protein IPI55_16885 [Flavobacteriales bacterium]|nr:hypothetical protein [Flavobacteriales bacterium]